MAVTRLQVFYSRGAGDKWTNVYHVDAADFPTVIIAWGESMQQHLLDILHVSCLLDKLLISSLDDDTFTEVIVGQGGDNGDTTDLLPLFNSIKAFFQPVGFGRPDYKFYKGTLTDDANAGGFIESTVITSVGNALNSMIADMSESSAPLCSENGDLWASVSLQQRIQMRQMHRRRARTEPTP
jgi:hypothetical protein